jgi:hypothetical protein
LQQPQVGSLYTVTAGFPAAAADVPSSPTIPMARNPLRDMWPAFMGSSIQHDLIFDSRSGRIGAMSDRGEHP